MAPNAPSWTATLAGCGLENSVPIADAPRALSNFAAPYGPRSPTRRTCGRPEHPRDIPRAGTQIEAARKKARIGMELAQLPLGVASEGSFGPDPFTGMLPWNVEVLIWIDNEYGIEISAVAQGKTNLANTLATNWQEAEAFAQTTGFPQHHLMVRPEGENDPRIRKGIADWSDLQAAFIWAFEQSENDRVFIETDMRAHANPTRMENIRLAAEELAKKLSCLCPA